MSIRFKILFGSLCLTLVTVLVGGFAQHAQNQLGTIATRLYDEAFMAVSYLREAQNELMKLNVAFDRLQGTADERGGPVHMLGLVQDAVPDIQSSLQVAHDRAMSPEGEASTQALHDDIDRLTAHAAQGASFDTLLAELGSIQKSFDTVVEIFAGDGYRYRKSVGQNIEQSGHQTAIAIAASLGVALLITFLLSRSIVPALRQVVGIAKSIAAGRLDNVIVSKGGGETAEMLEALGVMQGSIASNLARINALMAEQASTHAGEMAIQHGRFEAALNNMTQGLCLFDSAERLTIFNRRFGEMFGTPALGTNVHAVLAIEGQPPVDLDETPSFLRELADGRIIAVAHQRIEGGGWVATYEDVTERRRIEARFVHMARHDALTGLPNRVLFREHMADALAKGRGRDFSVLSLDLDGFKAINDTLGHPTGDALLQAVAERLLDCADTADMVARLGGDEFVVIQPAGGRMSVPALAQSLMDAFRLPFEIGGRQLVIGLSIGIASTTDLADPAAAGMPDTLLKNADLALYRAKADGRGTYRFFEAAMDARLQARRSLELDLQTALDRGQFELYYQPLVDTKQGRVAGFEALLRWHHPERGTVSPAEFIPVAEEIGLIKQIGAWVIERACHEAASWPEHVKVAVNLSPVQFGSPDLIDVVARALSRSGLAAQRLELEITESLLLQDSGAVVDMLHRLRNLGARIAMDDFGTGYSSLSYLQRFPFDKIKIDQGFVRQLADRPDSAAIVRAVIGLGKSLGMAILAEGVESDEQLAILQAEGCWDVQGYLFSPPRPADKAVDLMHSIAAGPAKKTQPRRVRSAA